MTSKTNLPLSCQKHHFTLKTISWSWAFDTHSSCLVWSRKSDSQGLACKGSHNAFKSVLDKSEQSQQIKLLNPLLKTLISASKILSALTFFFFPEMYQASFQISLPISPSLGSLQIVRNPLNSSLNLFMNNL